MKIPKKHLNKISILDDGMTKYNRQWKERYIHTELLSKDWDLCVEEYTTNGVGRDIYIFPCFTQRYCSELITMAENADRWSRARHQNYPTFDIELEWIGVENPYLEFLGEYIYPLAMNCFTWGGWDNETATIERDYKNEPATLVAETFLVKYKTGAVSDSKLHEEYGTCKMTYLPIHMDDSIASLLIPINDDYTGGGTKFPKQNVTLRPPAGNCILFPGGITHRHGARIVTEGTRYVIATFINIINQKGDGYDHSGKLLAKNDRAEGGIRAYKRDREKT